MKNIGGIILAIVFIGITFFVTKKFFPDIKTVVQTQTVTNTDTVWNDTVIYTQLPAPDPDTVFLYDTVKIEMPPSDLIKQEYAKLYQKYHSQYFYHDTLKNDTTALIVFEELVTENKPFNRNLIYQNRIPTVINKTTVIENQRKYFFGAEVGVQVVKPMFVYKDLNDFQYSVGYDLVGPERGLRFGMYISLDHIF